MPRMSKKRRLEWSFFLRQVKVGNTTCDRITYNDLCRGCTHSCKQSFRAVIILLSLIHIFLPCKPVKKSFGIGDRVRGSPLVLYGFGYILGWFLSLLLLPFHRLALPA